ncbi:uncharacterized protein LOC125813121 [Solanum verrucosum]|uniref:uncharacterized protein LOC125813121 n=1 Tax=Solanum verrucosum TaxID=315347 RepID=UPI0020D151CB|nr:uncharacterized protein LOC125813121 [Solanum verrucosum]
MTNSSQVNVGTVSATTTSVAHNRSTASLAPVEKPAKFSGVDFKRWQQKMFFYLTTLSLQRFINENVPVMSDETPAEERFFVTETCTHSNFLCKNYILSGLQDDLYNVYNSLKTSKELWDALEKKYKAEDVGMKKFIVAKFLYYKMIDMAAIIEKLSPLWKDFKNYLKHKRKEMTVEDLMVRLRIEEDNKAAEKRAIECQGPKKDKKKDQGNLAESREEMDDLCAMLLECNLVGNPRVWWIDSGASCHVCANKELFTSYTPAPADEKLFMVNSAVAKVEGTGKVHLKMTSGKVVTLNRVLYVPELRKNLVSIPVLTKNGFKCVFVSNKVVVSTNEMYVGKGYLTEASSNLM